MRGGAQFRIAGVWRLVFIVSVKNSFELLKRDRVSGARRGRLDTLHGRVETPQFMPVGTQATVKATFPATLEEIDAGIILGNTYHLQLRPGSELIRDLGGLHAFMSWRRPILTDSGGFQVFSLSTMRRITDEGVKFKSHLDGSAVFLGPEQSFQIQRNLGTDIAMVLDECPPPSATREDVAEAVRRTLLWARQTRRLAVSSGWLESGHLLFGITQGGRFGELRKKCTEALLELDFPGYAIGGVSVGESETEILEQVRQNAPLLPEEKPRYVMGVGTPPQLLQMVGMGIDLFDCVMPTRAARHGTVYTERGTLNLKNEQWKRDERPLSDTLDNYCCRNFSRAYLRHLVSCNEPLGGMLLTLHNLNFYLDLMRQARDHIEAGDYADWSAGWLDRYTRREEG